MEFEKIIKYIKQRLIAKDPEMRLAVCEHYCNEYNKNRKTCNKCNCYMPAKVKIAVASCPLRRW